MTECYFFLSGQTYKVSEGSNTYVLYYIRVYLSLAIHAERNPLSDQGHSGMTRFVWRYAEAHFKWFGKSWLDVGCH